MTAPSLRNYQSQKIVNLHVLAIRKISSKCARLLVVVHSPGPSCCLIVTLLLVFSVQIVATGPSDHSKETPHCLATLGGVGTLDTADAVSTQTRLRHRKQSTQSPTAHSKHPNR